MAKKTHPHKMVIFLKKNTKKFAFSVRKPIKSIYTQFTPIFLFLFKLVLMDFQWVK